MPCESRGGLQFHTKKVAPTVDICGLKPKGNDDDSPAIGAVTLTDDGSAFYMSIKSDGFPCNSCKELILTEKVRPGFPLSDKSPSVTLPTPEDLDAGL